MIRVIFPWSLKRPRSYLFINQVTPLTLLTTDQYLFCPCYQNRLKHIIQKHLSSHLVAMIKSMKTRENLDIIIIVMRLVDTFLTNMNTCTGVLFVDFAKAFDVINHSLLLLKKLPLHQCYQLSTETLELLSSFLCDRQLLVWNKFIQIRIFSWKHGVPRGSVVDPILFSVIIIIIIIIIITI